MPPVIKRRKLSYLWNFFTELDENFATCNLCRAKLSYKTSTSNLKRHMEIKHPTVSLNSGYDARPLETHDADAQSSNTAVKSPSDSAMTPTNLVKSKIVQSDDNEQVGSSSTSTSSLLPAQRVMQHTAGFRQTSMSAYIPKRVTPKCKQNIDDKLLRLFTDTFQPFRIVEERAFCEFVAALNPSYELPSRHMISRTLVPAMYEKCLNETRDVLKIAKKVCVTTDCWTSVNMESYMAVTVHFLNCNFKLISLLLECASLPVQHTAVNLATELKRVLTEWDVRDKLLIVVSDNAANIKAAIQGELGWKHLGCFAHTINLVVNDGLKEEQVFKIIGKVKGIVGHFKRSHVATRKLLLYQQNQGTANPLKLLQDVSTRWNSTFYMLERFIQLEEAVKTTMALTTMDVASHLTVEEWDIIRQVCQILKPFEKVSKSISGEEYLTASLVIPLAHGLNSVCQGFADRSLNEFVMNVVGKFKKSLDERFGNLENSNTLSIATLLDPRFKQIPFKDKKNAEVAKKNVISLVAEKFSAQHSSSHADPKPSTSNVKYNINSDSDDDIWAEFDKEASVLQPLGTSTSKAIIEVQRYLDHDRLQRKEDPLKWWRENKYMFPQLGLVAQERLSSIATSVPCERLFSKAGLILSDRRSRLSSTKTKMLLFLNSNSKMIDYHNS